MSNIHHLHRANLDQLCRALFTDPLELDRSRLILTERVDVFSIGDRVIVPPTPGAIDPACRQGGPGAVVDVREYPGAITPMAYVAVDDSTDVPQPYRFDELKRQPNV